MLPSFCICHENKIFYRPPQDCHPRSTAPRSHHPKAVSHAPASILLLPPVLAGSVGPTFVTIVDGGLCVSSAVRILAIDVPVIGPDYAANTSGMRSMFPRLKQVIIVGYPLEARLITVQLWLRPIADNKNSSLSCRRRMRWGLCLRKRKVVLCVCVSRTARVGLIPRIKSARSLQVNQQVGFSVS
jgi:hypothetical protein